jgi:two-component system cell cycle sensor histidine kinase/response regulator CckA
LYRPDLGKEEPASSTLVVADPALIDPAFVDSASATPASKALPRTVLLVEDEAFVREVACEVLSRAGYCVLKAGNATEALQVFREHAGAVQLLLTDVVLPDRNGCDLALELSTLCGEVKSIFVSGYPENVITRRGLRQPGWFYLPKPFSVSSLMQKIGEALPSDFPPR